MSDAYSVFLPRSGGRRGSARGHHAPREALTDSAGEPPGWKPRPGRRKDAETERREAPCVHADKLAQSGLTNINSLVAALFYVVAGLGWVLPAMPLISWMARPDKAGV